MTTFVLQGARAAAPYLTNTASRVALAYANQAISNALNPQTLEGPRLESLHIQTSRDGAPMPRVFGRARLAGQIIWASRFRETVSETSQGSNGKGGGGARVKNYSYSISFAIGLCEGEITSVERIWANGQPLQKGGYNCRVYTGNETQNPDPIIAMIEGDDAPAFRGTAYIVFEDFPLDDFGARALIPTFPCAAIFGATAIIGAEAIGSLAVSGRHSCPISSLKSLSIAELERLTYQPLTALLPAMFWTAL